MSRSVYLQDMDKLIKTTKSINFAKMTRAKKNLRKVAVFALAAAAAMLVHAGAVARQEVPPADCIPPAVVCTLPEPTAANIPAVDEVSPRKDRKSTLLQNIWRAAAALLSFVLPLILRLLTLTGKALLTPLLSPAAAAIAALVGDSLATFLLMVSMFSLLFLLIYPNRSLRAFFTLRNLFAMLTASAAVTLVLRFDPHQLSDELVELIHIAGAGFVTVLCAAKVLGAPSEKSAPADGGRSAGCAQS